MPTPFSSFFGLQSARVTSAYMPMGRCRSVFLVGRITSPYIASYISRATASRLGVEHVPPVVGIWTEGFLAGRIPVMLETIFGGTPMQTNRHKGKAGNGLRPGKNGQAPDASPRSTGWVSEPPMSTTIEDGSWLARQDPVQTHWPGYGLHRSAIRPPPSRSSRAKSIAAQHAGGWSLADRTKTA